MPASLAMMVEDERLFASPSLTGRSGQARRCKEPFVFNHHCQTCRHLSWGTQVVETGHALFHHRRMNMEGSYTVALAKGQGMPSETILLLKAWQESMSAVELK